MSSNNVWQANLGSEVGFWQGWFENPKFLEGRLARIEAAKSFAQYYVDLIKAVPGQSLRVLDVGSGPISTLGVSAKNNPVELVCTDALADDYNVLLDRHGYNNLPRIRKVKGEDLVAQFGVRAFDIVHCANALDHFEDPARSFENMYQTCRPGGALVIISVENEGEREKYQGLHQWNLRAADDGLFLASRSGSTNLLNFAAGYRNYSWQYLPSPAEFKIFRAIVMRGEP
jgi:SAM-dependent methyltransferase